VMEQTKIGEFSKPFRSKFGWHILQVMERRTQDLGGLFQKNQAQQVIHRRKFEEELANWLLEIKSEAFIEIKGETSDEMPNDGMTSDETTKIDEESADK